MIDIKRLADDGTVHPLWAKTESLTVTQREDDENTCWVTVTTRSGSKTFLSSYSATELKSKL